MKIQDRLDLQYKRYENEYNEAVIRALKSGNYILGEEVNKFEVNYAKHMESKYCVGLNNGLDALVLSLRVLGIKKGDEVIVQTNTFIATVMAITENGATPVFVEPDIYHNINVDEIECKITKNTKAIIVVHLYGQASNMGRIMEITNKHKLFLIEDCAQAHDATYEGKKIGTFGDVGCFSFYPTKNLGAFGDSGAIITDNQEIYEKMRMIRNYGSKEKYHNELNGVNSRLDELQAALLNVKLRHLTELTKERQRYAKIYDSGIKNSLIELPKVYDGTTHVYHLYVITCENRDKLQNYLLSKGIKTQIHYPIPPHLQKCYVGLGFKAGDFPVAEKYAKSVLSLPLFNGMTDEEINYVVKHVNKFSL